MRVRPGSFFLLVVASPGVTRGQFLLIESVVFVAVEIHRPAEPRTAFEFVLVDPAVVVAVVLFDSPDGQVDVGLNDLVR